MIKLDFIRIENLFCKTLLREWKDELETRKIFAKDISDKGLIDTHNIYKYIKNTCKL